MYYHGHVPYLQIKIFQKAPILKRAHFKMPKKESNKIKKSKFLKLFYDDPKPIAKYAMLCPLNQNQVLSCVTVFKNKLFMAFLR